MANELGSRKLATRESCENWLRTIVRQYLLKNKIDKLQNNRFLNLSLQNALQFLAVEKFALQRNMLKNKTNLNFSAAAQLAQQIN